METVKKNMNWNFSICIDDGTLASYVGLTSGKTYETKNHPNTYFIIVRKTDDNGEYETYPKRFFKQSRKLKLERILK